MFLHSRRAFATRRPQRNAWRIVPPSCCAVLRNTLRLFRFAAVLRQPHHEAQNAASASRHVPKNRCHALRRVAESQVGGRAVALRSA